VGQRQADDQATRVRVVDRRALSGEVGQQDQAVGSARRSSGQLGQRGVGVGAAFPLGGQLQGGKVVAEPAGQAAAGGHPGGDSVSVRLKEDRAPQPLGGGQAVGFLDEE